jgi:hypothetical protein
MRIVIMNSRRRIIFMSHFYTFPSGMIHVSEYCLVEVYDEDDDSTIGEHIDPQNASWMTKTMMSLHSLISWILHVTSPWLVPRQLKRLMSGFRIILNPTSTRNAASES